MSINTMIDDMVESKLLNLHTAYVGKIISVNGNRATVQPLTMIKQIGKNAEQQAPIPDVPILSHCRGKTIEKTISTYNGGSEKVLAFEPLKSGDIVFCVCAERNITDAINGKSNVPPIGRHSQSDSIVVGVL